MSNRLSPGCGAVLQTLWIEVIVRYSVVGRIYECKFYVVCLLMKSYKDKSTHRSNNEGDCLLGSYAV
jgi:hypothetical protein